jgi:hypothetical protein
MYSADDLAKTGSPCKTLEKVTKRQDVKRDAVLLEWLHVRSEQYKPLDKPIFLSSTTRQPHTETSCYGYLKDIITAMPATLPCHYSDVFWDDVDFCEYAKLSLCTASEKCFEVLAKIDENGEQELDSACQWLFGEIKRGAHNVVKANQTVDRSFMLQVFRLQTDQARMDEFHNKMPRGIRGDDTCKLACQLLVNFVAKLFMREFRDTIDTWLAQMGQSKETDHSIENWWDDTDSTVPATQSTVTSEGEIQARLLNNTDQQEQKEVQLFFGWALSSFGNKYASAEDDETEDIYAFCQEMYISHDEAVVDDTYMKDFYPAIIQLKNRGNLALVSRSYFLFGLQLLQKIRDEFNKATIVKYGKMCVERGYNELLSDEELRSAFVRCTNPHTNNLSDERIQWIYEQLVRKTFHARAGAETMAFKEANTSRFALDAVDTALREGLKTLSKQSLKALSKQQKSTSKET